jgi:hypothetical protein
MIGMLKDFQTSIAKFWEAKASDEEPFAKFFFLFSGFNALYFLWRTNDPDLKNIQKACDKCHRRDPEYKSEERQIKSLLHNLGEAVAVRILVTKKEAVAFFQARIIQRMDKRSEKTPDEGDPSEGERRVKILSDPKAPNLKKLEALGGILYQIRCNLVHGSKEGSERDERIIENANELLSEILKESMEFANDYGK